MKYGIDAKKKAENGGQSDHCMALLGVQDWQESLPVPKQMQYKNQLKTAYTNSDMVSPALVY